MNFVSSWGGVFESSLLGLWHGFINFIPGLLGAIILFLVGWVIGAIVGKAVHQVISAAKVDNLFESAGANNFLAKAGLKLNVGGFIGGIVKWFIVIVFLMASLEVIGLTQVNDFLREAVIYYLPKVIVASLVLIIATLIADAMQRLIHLSAKAINIRSAKMLGSITKYAIWIFAFIIAFSELGIATAFMQILFTGFVAALAIGLGLAFGLGGREAASKAIDRFSDHMSMKE